MITHYFASLLGAAIHKLPILTISAVSLIALLRSKTVPAKVAKIAAVGFACLLLKVGMELGLFATLLIVGETRTSEVLLAFQVGAVIEFLLMTLGLGLIARAIFAGRPNNSMKPTPESDAISPVLGSGAAYQ